MGVKVKGDVDAVEDAVEEDAGPKVSSAFVEVAEGEGEDEEDREAVGHEVDAGEEDAGGDDGGLAQCGRRRGR